MLGRGGSSRSVKRMLKNRAHGNKTAARQSRTIFRGTKLVDERLLIRLDGKVGCGDVK